MVFNANTESKTEYTIWKNIKNWAENWCQIVCGILFDLICCMTSSDDDVQTPEKMFDAWKMFDAILWCKNVFSSKGNLSLPFSSER